MLVQNKEHEVNKHLIVLNVIVIQQSLSTSIKKITPWLNNHIQDNADDFTFSNTVVWNSEVNNTNIDRELVLLDFKCIYQDEYTTDLSADDIGRSNDK